MNAVNNKNSKSLNLGMIMVIYLLGIFMGAIDTGIVTPARTVIQNTLMVPEQSGIWMLTIYTLAYASSIPVSGKLADRLGRKYIYLISIFLFGVGSLLCGLSSLFSSFPLLLFARVIQAIGGGGIIPVATAEFGTTFPPEKRGMALGLVGGVFGIANILGASVGSAILDIFGTSNWQFIFYINLPICLFIIIFGIIYLPNTTVTQVKRIDKLGVLLIVAMILSLLYGLRNINFFNFINSLQNIKVYPFLLAFIILLPLFIWIEKKADDPILNISYFTQPSILITLIVSFIVGIVMMGMIFVPQFCENILKIPTGKGGYFVVILGLFSGISAPISGKLVDKLGAKITLSAGFIISIIGCLFLIFIVPTFPTMPIAAIGLALVGLGMGFTLGAPLNYMMLANTNEEDSTSALSTLSLIRSIGTTIAPAIMIGFIAHAGASIQTNIMPLFPQTIAIPPLPYAQELTDTFNTLKTNPKMKEKLAHVEFPDLSKMDTISIPMGASSNTLSPDLLALMKTADVTTITERSKLLAASMFEQKNPEIIAKIQVGLDKGIQSLESTSSQMDSGISEMNQKITQLSHVPNLLPAQLVQIKKGLSNLENSQKAIDSTITKMVVLKDAIPGTFQTAKNNYLDAITAIGPKIETVFQATLNKGFKQVYTTIVIASIVGLIILSFYPNKKKQN